MDGFAVGEAAEAFDFISHGQEGFFPFYYNMLHRRRGRRKTVILGKIVQDGVVVCQHGVLELNLGGEQVREKGVDGGQQMRQTVSKGLVCVVVDLKRVSLSPFSYSCGRGVNTSLTVARSVSAFAIAILSRSDRLALLA